MTISSPSDRIMIGPAEAHRLPGDEERRAVLETADAERPYEAQSGAEVPAAAGMPRRRPQRAGEYRRRQAKSEQPQSLGLHAKGDGFPRKPDGKRDHVGRAGKRDQGRNNAAESARAQRSARPSAVQRPDSARIAAAIQSRRDKREQRISH